MLISGVPAEPIDVPPSIRLVRGDDPIFPIWVNGHGGIAFQIGSGADRRFGKWAPAGSGIDLLAEVERLQWASRFANVPPVLDHGHDTTDGDEALANFMLGYGLETSPALQRKILAYRLLSTIDTLWFEWRTGGDWFDAYRRRIAADTELLASTA